jgi:hypothetical protein
MSQLDGDWEHRYGLRIESLDNPGWLIRIDLVGTALENQGFEPIAYDDGQGTWHDMHIKEGVWQAACDPAGLERAIKTFLGWARWTGSNQQPM